MFNHMLLTLFPENGIIFEILCKCEFIFLKGFIFNRGKLTVLNI